MAKRRQQNGPNILQMTMGMLHFPAGVLFVVRAAHLLLAGFPNIK